MKNQVLMYGLPVGVSALALLYYYYWRATKDKDDNENIKKSNTLKVKREPSEVAVSEDTSRSKTKSNADVQTSKLNGSNGQKKTTGNEAPVSQVLTLKESPSDSPADISLGASSESQSSSSVKPELNDPTEPIMDKSEAKSETLPAKMETSCSSKTPKIIDELSNSSNAVKVSTEPEIAKLATEPEIAEVSIEPGTAEVTTEPEITSSKIAEVSTESEISSSNSKKQNTEQGFCTKVEESVTEGDLTVDLAEENRDNVSVITLDDSVMSVTNEKSDIVQKNDNYTKSDVQTNNSSHVHINGITSDEQNGNTNVEDSNICTTQLTATNVNTTIDLSDSVCEVTNGNEPQVNDVGFFELQPDFRGHEKFYSNHTLVRGFPFVDDNTPHDSQKIWAQPNDNMVFVSGSAGQPLVPSYLRNVDFLKNRPIPYHSPAEYEYIAQNMKPPSFPALQWVRVISVSNTLEIRVRDDQRDMLLDELENDGIFKSGKPIRASDLDVGSLVAAKMNVPLRGNIWCRVIITKVINSAQSSRRGNGGSGNRNRSDLRFLVESIDYYPMSSEEPLTVNQLRPLTEAAFSAPFHDQIIYLSNCMPKDRARYPESVRDELLSIIKKSNNYLYITANVGTIINGVYNSFSPLYARYSKDGVANEVLLNRELTTAGLVTPIYKGIVDSNILYCLCMFKDNDAFWMNDNRDVQYEVFWPETEYIYVTDAYSQPGAMKGYRGFSIPYRHKAIGFPQNTFNLTINQYCNLFRLSNNYDPDSQGKLAMSLNLASVPLDINFTSQAYSELMVSNQVRQAEEDLLVNGELYVSRTRGFLTPKNLNSQR